MVVGHAKALHLARTHPGRLCRDELHLEIYGDDEGIVTPTAFELPGLASWRT